jgi:hypothetical protein
MGPLQVRGGDTPTRPPVLLDTGLADSLVPSPGWFYLEPLPPAVARA